MKITRIETFPVSIPLKPERRMVSALGEYNVSQYVLVRVSTDAGIDGAGEATVLPRWSGETVWGAQALIDRVLAPRLIGWDPTDIDGVADLMDEAAEDNWFAKSALEMACWDICGKDFGKPVYVLLGGPARSTAVRCRFSMGAYDADTATRRARELIAAGFDTIKVKVGTEVARDIERVRAVRKAIGPGPALVIDANCGYDSQTAIDMAREIEDCDVVLFEQPTPRGDFEALAEVRRAIRPQVMADDICFDFADAVECIRHRACDVISVYPGKNGGLAKSKRIVDYAGLHGVACTIGSNLELDIASAAMCHLVVACRNINVEKYPGDIMGPDYHAVSVVKEPLEIRGPLISITDRPGLGIDVDWKAVEAHPCK
jgi:L-alanine-DL-glutamate epimerase-like enolase superfamily enzyme